MSYQLAPFAPIELNEPLLECLIGEHEAARRPRFDRLWRYYRNALAEPTDRGGSIGAPDQSVGLPARLLADPPIQNLPDDRIEREIVIENDIAWRIHTLVDFMFPAQPRVVSRASTSQQRSMIEAILSAVFEASGGIALWQDAALLSSVYGHVDFLLDAQALALGAASLHRPANRAGVAPSEPSPDQLIRERGHLLRIETVAAPRAIPLLSPSDYRTLLAYIIHNQQETNDTEQRSLLQRLTGVVTGRPHTKPQRATETITRIYSASHVQTYRDGALIDEYVNRLGRLPIVHVQNLSQPLMYEGLSDVEPLIPLQDELNTRISDRANRVTMQSFRMWLARGIEGFTERPIGPGQMWLTENPDATIESFGGDADSPSERAHLEELREALDKASGVTPAAAGHIRARVGNLTSENALRISLMGTIAKTQRKRVTFTAGIQQLAELILHALDVHGVYRSAAADRQIDVVWTDPLAPDESRRLSDALLKAQLGVPLSTLRAELGYTETEANTINDRKPTA